MSSDLHSRPRADLLERAIGQELALFDVESGIVHTLNPSAAIVWHGLVDALEYPQLLEALKEAFGIDDSEAEQGVEAALEHFKRADLLEME